MSDFNWDQFANASGFWTAENVGDSIAGDILTIRIGQDFNKQPVPELVIRTAEGDDVAVTAGQVVLKRLLAEIRPQVGEKIGITYTGAGEAKPGKAPAKLFTVQVRGTDGQLRQAPAAAAPAPAAPVAPPVTTQAATAPSASSLV